MWMRVPDAQQLVVDLGGHAGRFNPQRVAVVIPTSECRRAQVNHRVVPAHLVFLSRADRLPKGVGTWPVRRTIDRSAVAQHNRRVACLGGTFELTLDEEDRALRAT